MDINSFIVHVKTDDIVGDSEARFDNSNFELDRPLPKAKEKGNWINERWIMWRNHERICLRIKTKNI